MQTLIVAMLLLKSRICSAEPAQADASPSAASTRVCGSFGRCGAASRAPHSGVPGSGDSPWCFVSISIDNRMVAVNRYTLPVNNWQACPCQAGFADRFIHPVQPRNHRQEVLVPLAHQLIVTRQSFLHTLCHENRYDFR